MFPGQGLPYFLTQITPVFPLCSIFLCWAVLLHPCAHYSMAFCWSLPEISFQNLVWDSLLPASQLHSHVCYQVSVYVVSAFLHYVFQFHSHTKQLDIGGTHIQAINTSFLAKFTCFHIFRKIPTILASKYLADYHADPQISLMKILNLKQH